VGLYSCVKLYKYEQHTHALFIIVTLIQTFVHISAVKRFYLRTKDYTLIRKNNFWTCINIFTIPHCIPALALLPSTYHLMPTLVVKSVQSELPIWGCGALIGHSSNMYSTIGIKWYVRGNRACANWDIQTCFGSLEYSALTLMLQALQPIVQLYYNVSNFSII
jgi:hypothetical protein